MWTFCGGRRVSLFNIPQCLKATGTQYGPKPWFSSGFYAFFTIYYFPLLLPQSITTERDSTLLKNWHLLSILSFTPRSYSPSLCSSCVQFFVTPWTTRFLCTWDFPGKYTGVGCISASRGSSRPRDEICISCIGRQVLYLLSHQGSPRSPGMIFK